MNVMKCFEIIYLTMLIFIITAYKTVLDTCHSLFPSYTCSMKKEEIVIYYLWKNIKQSKNFTVL